MTDGVWLVLLILSVCLTVHLVARASYRRWARKKCRESGHLWWSLEGGFVCRRCLARRFDGERM